MRWFFWKFFSVSSLFLVVEPAFATGLEPIYIPLIVGALGAGATVYGDIQSRKAASKQRKSQRNIRAEQREYETGLFNKQLELDAEGKTVDPTEEVDRNAPTAQQVRQAQVKSVDEQRGRSGRRSTILTSGAAGRSGGAKRTTLG